MWSRNAYVYLEFLPIATWPRLRVSLLTGSDGKQKSTDQEDSQSSSGLWGGLRVDKDDIITIVGALAISYFIRTYGLSPG